MSRKEKNSKGSSPGAEGDQRTRRRRRGTGGSVGQRVVSVRSCCGGFKASRLMGYRANWVLILIASNSGAIRP